MKVLNFEITSKHAQKALGMVAGLGAGMIVDHYTKGLAKSLKNPVKKTVEKFKTSRAKRRWRQVGAWLFSDF